jgi:integrase
MLSPYTVSMTLKRLEPASGKLDPVFKKVGENLYRHAPSGNYYALLKRGGKQFRRSLKTSDRALAHRRLVNLRQKIANLTLTDTRNANFDALATSWLDGTRHALKPATISRREVCIKGLAPFFRNVPIRNISMAQCDKWLEKRGNSISASSFAQELDTLRLILDYAVKRGLLLDNPAASIKRRKIVSKRIVVPTREQFRSIIAAVRDGENLFGSQGRGKDGADLLELLAYSGCRLREATELRWKDVDFERSCITVTGGEGGTKNHETRTVPMAPALKELLNRLNEQRLPDPTDTISVTKDAKKCLRTACRKLELPHFTHHDLRHFFATTCIESGVDIPTISRWLGHKDGGALAMRVYGHLRQEHSFEMSRRVNFETKPASENVVRLPGQAIA